MATLTAAQKRLLRERLEAQRTQLVSDIVTELSELGRHAEADRARQVADSGDEAVSEFVSALDADLASRHGVALQETEQALARLEGGRYGECENCGVDIPFARLEAQPTARRCAPCQTRYEQEHPRPRGL